MKQINFDDFLAIEICSWTIIDVKSFPEARNPAYKIWVDFWTDIWIKKTSAQVTDYSKEELLWKQVCWVVNFPPKQVWKFMSQFLLTAFIDKNGTAHLAVPDKKIDNWVKLV
jgi:tRNA-binding protein